MGAQYFTDLEVTKFNAMLDAKEQQTQSKLKPLCKMLQPLVNAEDMAYDGSDQIEPQRANESNPDLQFKDMNWSRRQVTTERIVTAVLYDKKDVNNVLADVQGTLAEGVHYGHERECDRVIYDRMFADVRTGKKFAGTLTYANDGGESIDATQGLTYETLDNINSRFLDTDIDISGGTYMGVTGDEVESLMHELELTSGDFTRQNVVDQGTITRAAGHYLITYGANVVNPILEIENSERISFCLVRGAMAFTMRKSREVNVYPHPLKVDSMIVKVVEEIGAVRTRGTRIKRMRFTP